MPEYQYENLGPRAFEQLSVALVAAVVGPDIEVYGSGPDGGREATYRGKLSWSDETWPSWVGYTVFQAKQKERQETPEQNLAWLKKQISQELKDWWESRSRRRLPDHLLFISNARLSASTGVDEIDRHIAKLLEMKRGNDSPPKTLRETGLKDVKVWHRDKLNALLDGHQSIRHAYDPIMTVGDLLARLDRIPGTLTHETLAPFIKEQARCALRDERWVRFNEASKTNQKQYIDEVFIDLPVRPAHQTTPVNIAEGALAHCLRRGDQVLRRSQWRSKNPRHIVITGAPGNGKSTLTSFLAQTYRATFIDPESDNPQPTISAIGDTQAALQRCGISSPRTPRWPIRVDLADMATEIGFRADTGKTLRKYLAEVLSRRLDTSIQSNELRTWMKYWPCAVLFDGLDEVVESTLRTRVLEEIDAFVEESDSDDCDLFVVLTTRPTGYDERIRPDDFEQVDLDYLGIDAALEYARRITELRLQDDRIQAESVMERLAEAARDSSLSKLMLTPLQVLMLTYIIEQSSGDLPASRFHLFNAYYAAVFSREAAKNTSYKNIYTEYGTLIDDLHERVGLTLHVQCETAQDTRARLPMDRVRHLARQRFEEIGIEDQRKLDQLVENVTSIAMSRLVLLVGEEDGSVAFEVRSLQELMAARALTNGNDTTVVTSLGAVIAHPHWRNVLLLAAGRLFSEQDHRIEAFVHLIEQVDDSTWPGWLYPVAPEVAASCIIDGIAKSRPLWLRRLATVALRGLKGPMPWSAEVLAVGLGTANAQDKQAGTMVRAALRSAQSGTPVERAVADTLIQRANFGPIFPESDPRVVYPELWNSPLRLDTSEGKPLDAFIRPHLDAHGDSSDPESVRLVEHAINESGVISLVETGPDQMAPQLQKALPAVAIEPVLRSEAASSLLRTCLEALMPSDWAARSVFARGYFLGLTRRPVGKTLPQPYLGVGE